MDYRPHTDHLETMEPGCAAVCHSCGQLLTSPADGIRADDGRCMCTACYRQALLPGHRGCNTETMD